MSRPEAKEMYTSERAAKISAAQERRWGQVSEQEKSEVGKRMRAAWTPETEALIRATKEANGTLAPTIRGGNGHPPTRAEQLLLDSIPQLVWNYSIPTHMERGSGFPPTYKVDLAVPSILLAVECDGNSHRAAERRFQDQKKDQFLAGLGWLMLRFWNQDIETGLETVVGEVQSAMTCRFQGTPHSQ